MNSGRWSRDQLLRTLALYCQTPFGRMHHRNPTVIALAGAIGRTPSAVAMKLVNFASLDPDLAGRGIRGMGNTSEADRTVWAEFYGRWDVLADAAIVVEANAVSSTPESIEVAVSGSPDGPTEVLVQAKARRGQAFFRAAVMAAHDGKCCITGITNAALLRASHIVPWSADPALRLDPRNGLCLNALHDAAFDRGLITLTGSFELRVSKALRADMPTPLYKEMFESKEGLPVVVPERFRPSQQMLAYHRESVFIE